MKLAIQGHSKRGKEVIQILESLGGINDGLHEGNNPDCYYELHGNIIWCVSTKGINFKYYTLEEFEREFPFKIGDKIVCKENLHALHTIMGISYNPSSCLQYEIKEDKTGIIVHYPTDLLIKYKEMKEERNITLTLEKAKEWYKKGGELKEIALQAFTEKELNSLPRSWEEYCMTHGCVCLSARYTNISLKYDALIKLEQLRDCWRQDWKPDYTKTYKKYRIKKLGAEYIVDWSTGLSDFLVFQTKELADEFLKCFKDLIEKAGDLI